MDHKVFVDYSKAIGRCFLDITFSSRRFKTFQIIFNTWNWWCYVILFVLQINLLNLFYNTRHLIRFKWTSCSKQSFGHVLCFFSKTTNFSFALDQYQYRVTQIQSRLHIGIETAIFDSCVVTTLHRQAILHTCTCFNLKWWLVVRWTESKNSKIKLQIVRIVNENIFI